MRGPLELVVTRSDLSCDVVSSKIPLELAPLFAVWARRFEREVITVQAAVEFEFVERSRDFLAIGLQRHSGASELLSQADQADAPVSVEVCSGGENRQGDQ